MVIFEHQGWPKLLDMRWASSPRFEGGSFLTFPRPSQSPYPVVPWNLLVWPFPSFITVMQNLNIYSIQPSASSINLKANLMPGNS